MYVKYFLPFLFLPLLLVHTVDRNNFKTCEQSSFCKRCRNAVLSAKRFDFVAIEETITLADDAVRGILLNKVTNVRYYFLLEPLVDNTVRLRINEENAPRPRYQAVHALISEPVNSKRISLVERTESRVVFKTDHSLLVLQTEPFKLRIYYHDVLAVDVNDFGKFVFEHQRVKPTSSSDSGGGNKDAGEDNNNNADKNNDADKNDQQHVEGEWEEYFKEHLDSKPYGPMAVALDFSFPQATHVYGIPSHADSLSLKSTVADDGGQPYRLYNLDVFEYELNNRMALYGSVPVAVAHAPNITVGVFWLNAAETWVDIRKEAKESSTVMESIVNFVSGSSDKAKEIKTGLNTHFMSETGIIDVFFMLGPNPYDVTRQYSRLTGTATLPPLFSLGYHQSRWNYFQDDVRDVQDNYDHYDMPIDAIWLDIEYTDNKKYFTWDYSKFPSPSEMQRNLTARGRKLIVIIDPHIKRDNSYFLHTDATSKGLYVKTKDGDHDYEGWCWPGSSSYLDFTNPDTVAYYTSLYLLENFPDTTEDTFIWNDMNEPSVFNGPEVTMPKDCLHHGGVEHRELHNMYGLLQLTYTYLSLLKRSDNRKRPFILSRAHFAGAQRYAAIWTGDNAAEWGHLKMSVPMCLSSALGGISFCGADVGGFFKNPDARLFVRWYQTAAYLPFFRGHSHIDTARREPWLFNESVIRAVRDVLKERYAMLPVWYTLFYQHTLNGAPVIRPLFFEFPKDAKTFDIDYEFLVGNSLLVYPITDPDVSSVNVYFPDGNHVDEVWYDKDTYRMIKHVGPLAVDASLDRIPVFIRGGSIIPRKNRVRRSAVVSLNDPYTLIVALNANGAAVGHVFIDDGESFEYQRNNYLYLKIAFSNNQLTSSFVSDGRFDTKSWLEKVVILGIPNVFKRAIVKPQEQSEKQQQTYLNLSYDLTLQTLTIRKPSVSMAKQWTIILE